MRPEVVEVVGFGVFRDRTVVDLRGADLVALSGPTGSGKSTVIDAIVFALYGSVPRYDNRNLVAPVISQGKVEARVRLDFSVAGVPYRVVRIVRANARGGGASTKEARLERLAAVDPGDVIAEPDPGDALDETLDGRSDGTAGDDDGGRIGAGSDVVEVLAGTGDEVTDAVTALLGLTYEHFTTCVVLPQGDFQRFLHAKPAARQDLLVELLDLGVYGRMAQLARARAAAAAQQRTWLAQQLEELATYTPEVRARLQADVDALDALRSLIDEVAPELDRLAASVAEARTVEADTAARAERLAGVRLPDGLADAAAGISEAEAAVAATAAQETTAAEALEAAGAALDGLGDRRVLEAARADRAARTTEQARQDKGNAVVERARSDRAERDAAWADARAAHDKVAAALADAQLADRARALAADLVVGEPCPVCQQTVHDLPVVHTDDLDGLAADLRAQALVVADTEQALAEATGQVTRCEGLLAGIAERLAELDERLSGAPDEGAVEAGLARFDAAEADLKACRAAEQQAREQRRVAERDLEDRRGAEAGLRRDFDATRDAVAVLEPPAPARASLAADWRELVDWATAAREREQAAAAAARTAAAEAAAALEAREAGVRERCVAAGIETTGSGTVRDAVVQRLADARADVESIDGAIARAADLRATDAALATTEQVASGLAGHLRSSAFERWVLDEVLARLMVSATEILHTLSAGAYSLAVDGRGAVVVVDHANADLTRPARTLSGGETFLASLALALALADEVAQVASGGASRIESMFLDEGFGTLDPATLDTVATAIEELGSSGRMVGLVTHVRDLAERLPVRIEITRGPNASTVERVDL
jgi:exonuclease SbcC